MSWPVALVYDRFMRKAERARLSAWRTELLADLRGDVLEVGAGTGANVPLYPLAVERLVLAEPDRHMRRRLCRRLAATPRAGAQVSDSAVEALPFAAATFDAVVATLVLCSVVDVGRSLAEIRRVLRPSGVYVFIEHVAETSPRRLAWQRRLEPLWARLAGNCHVTRRSHEDIEAAGFLLDRAQHERVNEAFPLFRPFVRGTARSP